MKEIELFYLNGCPYCRNAERALTELRKEDPRYAAVKIRWIEENRERELADSRDYYYVPALFIDGMKCYEAHPGANSAEIRDSIRRVLEKALEGE